MDIVNALVSKDGHFSNENLITIKPSSLIKKIQGRHIPFEILDLILRISLFFVKHSEKYFQDAASMQLRLNPNSKKLKYLTNQTVLIYLQLFHTVCTKLVEVESSQDEFYDKRSSKAIYNFFHE